ncbi:hypothetical protein JJB07_07635 [Tumebacillus sp. ITR2]|uniref:Uncharacterized protein n=1 Tax=Tumebacillus amylolyticus TaxID=2801339 RepID=A0ABS1J8B4_9BACL|nr:hypothetical protein [Tumebacillus amylolyticus]MBL0386517.1 hypothetical protein [Tumebacillus amylolyticus]
MTARFEFVFNERLGIQIPVQHHEWHEYTRAEQEDLIHRWESIRSRIPDRIKELEEIIEDRQLKIAVEDDWDRVVELYEDVFFIASVINDLNNWMRLEPSTTDEEGHGLAEEHASREKD